MSNYVYRYTPSSHQDYTYFDNHEDYLFSEESPTFTMEATSPIPSYVIHDISEAIDLDDSMSFTSEHYWDSENYSLEPADHASFCSSESQPEASLSTDSATTESSSAVSIIDPVELQLEFLRTLKKLDRSIKRTDQSRSVVMRLHAASNRRLFDSSEWNQVMEHRQIFSEIIHRDSLTRTAF